LAESIYFYAFTAGNNIIIMRKIAGRAEEISLLNDYLISDKAEFVVIYGRRRVGKTPTGDRRKLLDNHH